MRAWVWPTGGGIRSTTHIVLHSWNDGNAWGSPRPAACFVSKTTSGGAWLVQKWRNCSKVWRRVDSQVDTGISEKQAVTNFNNDIYVRIYTASKPRTTTSSFSSPWEPEIAQCS
jgi:hypothetical protein